jgi:hypothetical protein
VCDGFWIGIWHCTVKKFDEVVRHLHLVTQDQFSLVSKKDSGSHEDNCNKNIEVFRQTFTNVEVLRQRLNVSKLKAPGRELSSSEQQSIALPLRHTYLVKLNVSS